MLEAAGKRINLCAAIPQLRGHGVERAHQYTKFVLSLLRDLIIEVAGGDFASAFGKRLDGHGDLFCEKQGHPHYRRQKENRKEKEYEKHLVLERAKVLPRLVVLACLRLNRGEPREHIRARAVGSHGETRRFSILEILHARSEIISASRLPNFHPALKRPQVVTGHIGLHADRAPPVFRLIVANRSTSDGLSFLIQNPNSIGALGERVPQEVIARASRFRLHLQGQAPQPRQLRATEIVQELLRFFGSGFERFWKPQHEAAIDKGIADDKHEYDGQERQRHGPDNHLGFEPCAKLVAAAFHPEPQCGAA